MVDDGPSIAPEERTEALERFYRVLGTVGEGNGLGLAIADEIARVHKTQLVLADAKEGKKGFSRPAGVPRVATGKPASSDLKSVMGL